MNQRNVFLNKKIKTKHENRTQEEKIMRVKQITNVDGFYKALAKCQGRVELITDDRDVLNLASTLTQFIGLTTVFSNPNIEAYEIV